MGNDLFSIGPFTIHGYGLMIAIGLVSGYLIADKRAEKQKLDTNHLMNLFLACMVGCGIGGKLLFCLVELPSFIENPAMLFDFGNGFVIYGGLIGGFMGGYIYCKVMNVDFLRYFEIFIPSLAFAQGIGRIGCFLAGCCYGKPTTSWFHVIYETSTIAPLHVPLIPTQLIMSALDLLLAGVLFYLAHKKVKRGMLLGSYITFYSVGRFLVEFLRDDPRGYFGIFSTSQMIGIVGFVVGLYVLKKYNSIKE